MPQCFADRTAACFFSSAGGGAVPETVMAIVGFVGLFVLWVVLPRMFRDR